MNVPEYFGSLVFDDRAMKERLSADDLSTVSEGAVLKKLSELSERIFKDAESLDSAFTEVSKIKGTEKKAIFYTASNKHLGRPLSLLFTAAHFLFYLGKETI